MGRVSVSGIKNHTTYSAPDINLALSGVFHQLQDFMVKGSLLKVLLACKNK